MLPRAPAASRKWRRATQTDQLHGLKLGVLLVKLRTRLLGPLTTLATDPAPRHPARGTSELEAAFRQVDAALDQLCATLGFKPTA